MDFENSFERYSLDMLGKLVAVEEFITKRPSGLRTFCRLDVTVFRDCQTGNFQYTLNDINIGHSLALFSYWDKAGQMKIMFQEIYKTLHFLSYKRKYCVPTSQNPKFP
jgi:hypothetical protein